MARLLGILILVLGLYGLLLAVTRGARSISATLLPLTRDQAYFAVLTLGAAIVIITGGIDLSVGSVVGLAAVLFGLLMQRGVVPLVAIAIVLAAGLGIGLIHGLLVTKLKLQPFLVTLCGLFIYRGLAQFASAGNVGWTTSTADWMSNPGFKNQAEFLHWLIEQGSIGQVPVLLFLTLALAAVIGVFLHATVYGRYLYAIGANEQAVRYTGVPTDRYKILAYMICSTLAALGGVLELVRQGTANPANSGSLYELYAITGAVLGGCSLRGGQGNVIGILLGAMVLPLLLSITVSQNLVSPRLRYTLIGLAMLAGTIGDELLKRRSAGK